MSNILTKVLTHTTLYSILQSMYIKYKYILYSLYMSTMVGNKLIVLGVHDVLTQRTM